MRKRPNGRIRQWWRPASRSGKMEACVKSLETIYIMDCITPHPGRGAEVLYHYLENYVPVGEERGLTLRHKWVSPPVWLKGNQTNTLYFVWSVTGVAGYWGAEAKARWDASTPDFWRDLEPMIQSRTRQVMAEDTDIESLCDV
jgi:hypothetical protein